MANRKQLGQANPGATPASIYTPGTNLKSRKMVLYVSETSGTDRTWSLYHDDNGTTYDDTTALYVTIAILASTTTSITLDFEMSAGNLAVAGSSTDVTFTLYGEETAA